MIRKSIRLRKEYLYNKEKEIQERATNEKKRKLKDAIDNDKAIPTELRGEQDKLLHELEMDDKNTIVQRTHIDDEYEEAKYRDPSVLITTSRDPSMRLLQFQKELRLIFSGSVRMNRGSYVLKDIVKMCRERGFTDLVVLHEHKGEPDGMIVSHLPFGPTAYFGISDVILRHDLDQKAQTMSEAFPHLIFDGFESRLGDRLSDILKYLFPVPKVDSSRVMTFANKNDFISFRHHVTKEDKEDRDVQLKELGPRFEMKPYQITLGTLDQPEAKKEWVLRPYMNTAKKRKTF